MLRKLRIKFVAVTTSISTLLLCVIMFMLYTFNAAAITLDVNMKMQSISDNLIRRGISLDLNSTDDRLHYFILTQNDSGDLIVTGTDGFDFSKTDLLSDLFTTAMHSKEDMGVIENHALKYLRISHMANTVLYVDISDEMSGLLTLRQTCIFVGILSVLVFSVIAILLVNWIVHPVEVTWEQQKQFVADASHELKTPLTVIMTNMEMLASPVYTTADKDQIVNNTVEMTRRMRYLVEGMLDLARLDSGTGNASFTQVDYSDLTEQCVLPYEPVFFEAGKTLAFSIGTHILLKGSESHLCQVTDILLDNALKYSAPNTTVKLSLQQIGRHALLCVDSMGPEISQEDLQNIFRRFYTLDKARTGSSYGLGLSIAKSIVEEHKGKIWAESSGGHNRFYVKLPLS